MILFGNINQGSGNYWQDIGGGILDIANGATGLAVALPSDPRFSLLLNNSGGAPLGSFRLVDGVESWTVGVTDQGGAKVAVIYYFNSATGISRAFSLTDAIASVGANDGTNYSSVEVDKDSVFETVSDQTVGTGVNRRLDKDKDQIDFAVAGVDILKRIIDPTGFSIGDGSSNLLFKIANDGKILTNQAVPFSHAIPTKEMPVYDAAGTLLGYVTLNT